LCSGIVEVVCLVSGRCDKDHFISCQFMCIKHILNIMKNLLFSFGEAEN